MKVLLTGTEGYLGCLMAPYLMKFGHDVIGLDTGFYKDGWLFNGSDLTPKTLNKDVRNVTQEDLQGIDAVVHLAELSNDPAGQLNPAVTYDINYKGSVRLARTAKMAGATRFVYTSSCSVYGVAGDSEVTEESPVNPQTDYAICKTLVERDVKTLADDNFSPTFLRNATAYGASPRMRFDVVLNNLSGLAWTTHTIRMTSDGTPWRPLVHALDICKAVRCSLEVPRELVHNQIFNVGDSSANYRVREIAETVAGVFDGCTLVFGEAGADNRSYRVSFEKINRLLPGFACEWDVAQGARQLLDLFSQIDMSPDTFRFRAFTRLTQLEHLIRTRQIDDKFLWTKEPSVYVESHMPLRRQVA